MDTIINIKSGSYDVLCSGSVIQFDAEPVTISFLELFFVFKFINDDNEKQRQEFNISNNIFTLILYNFNNSLGTGNTQAINLGSINNRNLYLNYRIYTLSDLKHDRTIYYTFYLGEEIIHG